MAGQSEIPEGRTGADQQERGHERQTTLAQVHAFPSPPAGDLLAIDYRSSSKKDRP
jgi:hypothetical protein